MIFELKQDGTYELCGIDINETTVTIPNLYLGKPVTSIKGSAIVRNKSIRKIVMCDNIVEIGNSSIFQCQNLEEVQLGRGLRTIGNNVFRDCPALKYIHITEKVEKIGSECFDGSNIESITVDTLNKCFDSRDNCNAVIDTNSNTLLVGSTKTSIPSSVVYIGKTAFKGRGISQIVIPQGVESIGEDAFANCKYLKKIVFPSSVRVIGKNAFANCTSLSEVIIPEGVGSIEEGAFKNCTSLRDIDLPMTLKSLGKETFKLCNCMSQVIIHDSIQTIGNNAFKGCSLSDNIIFYGTQAKWRGINLGNNDYINPSVKFHFADSIDAYEKKKKSGIQDLSLSISDLDF